MGLECYSQNKILRKCQPHHHSVALIWCPLLQYSLTNKADDVIHVLDTVIVIYTCHDTSCMLTFYSPTAVTSIDIKDMCTWVHNCVTILYMLYIPIALGTLHVHVHAHVDHLMHNTSHTASQSVTGRPPTITPGVVPVLLRWVLCFVREYLHTYMHIHAWNEQFIVCFSHTCSFKMSVYFVHSDIDKTKIGTAARSRAKFRAVLLKLCGIWEQC